MSKIRIFLTLILFATILHGCTSIKHYRSQTPNNIVINNNVVHDIWFSSVYTLININKIQSNCVDTDFQGSILLDSDDKDKKIGIPTNQPTYIQIGLLKRTPSTIMTLASKKTIFIPKNGETYMIDVSYKDKYYEVKFKKKSKAGVTTTFSAIPMEQCQSILSEI